jgi:hypothetical protein
MGVANDIVASWRRPAQVMRGLLAAGQREDRALAFLMLACFLIFVAQWPTLSRQAFEDPSVPLQARIGGALFGWLFWAPILSYGLAALTRIAAMPFGGRGTWYTARLALFWSLLAATPGWLFYGMITGFIGPGPAANVVGAVLLFAFLSIWGITLRVAETEGMRDVTP